MENMCGWKDNIKMNLQGIELRPGLDTSGRGEGEGGLFEYRYTPYLLA
jgi:hypothetical protein